MVRALRGILRPQPADAVPDPPPHLSTLGDPRAPLARMVAAGLTIAALAVGLLIYGGTREAPEAGAEAGGGPEPTAPTSLWVNADPAGSAVFVDGDSVGVVPLWLDQVADGTRRVRIVSASGRTLVDTTVQVVAGQVADLDLAADDDPFVARASTDVPEGAESIAAAPEPEPDRSPERATPAAAGGELRVTSDPPGAQVLLDGRRVGTTPLSVGGVRPGRHSVTVERRGYQAAVRPVTIRPGGVFETVVDLRPAEVAAQTPPPAPRPAPAPAPARPAPSASPVPSQTGIVEILVRPWGSIVIDGVTLHEATDVVYRAELAAGVHRVFVANPSYGSDERTITVVPGSRSRIEFNLAGGGR